MQMMGAYVGQYSFPHSSCIVSRELLLLDITSLLASKYLRDQLGDLIFHDSRYQWQILARPVTVTVARVPSPLTGPGDRRERNLTTHVSDTTSPDGHCAMEGDNLKGLRLLSVRVTLARRLRPGRRRRSRFKLP